MPQYVIPRPCTAKEMAEAHEWEELNEDEDEAEMKLKHLGVGGAATDWKVRVQNLSRS